LISIQECGLFGAPSSTTPCAGEEAAHAEAVMKSARRGPRPLALRITGAGTLDG
jgi:hypothetical protein